MRDGVLLLFYDVSAQTKADRAAYRKLFKTLRKEGYMMLQESVFYKYLRNLAMYPYEVARIKELEIGNGDVFCLPLGFRSFSRMIAIHGNLPDMQHIASPVWYY